jgi:lysophospholipase L1-like esterase
MNQNCVSQTRGVCNVKTKILATVALAAAAGSAMPAALAATDSSSHEGTVLALGDSAPFGYITRAGFQYVNADNFIAYPQYLGLLRHEDAVNASCPGETTGSFFSLTAIDNGCRAYRAAAPLHVSYASTQLEFATSYLKQHGNVRVVTLQLGANDGLLLLHGCAAAPNPTLCVQQGLPAVAQSVATNIGTILALLRATGYGGPILIVNYYSTDYSDRNQTALTALLNQAISAPAAAYGASVVDVFSAFARATSAPAIGGKTCHAGLLNVNPLDTSSCDDHPAQSGHQLIAETVDSALEADE